MPCNESFLDVYHFSDAIERVETLSAICSVWPIYRYYRMQVKRITIAVVYTMLLSKLSKRRLKWPQFSVFESTINSTRIQKRFFILYLNLMRASYLNQIAHSWIDVMYIDLHVNFCSRFKRSMSTMRVIDKLLNSIVLNVNGWGGLEQTYKMLRIQ